jgi:hypothetical protein
MPVNMDPSKKRRRSHPTTALASQKTVPRTTSSSQQIFGEETEVDREKDMADAELKNLWDATEVIDMDKT